MTTINYPMPDLRCPSWCPVDHSAEWQAHVRLGTTPYEIPAEGGGILQGPRTPLAEWLAGFEPLHVLNLATVRIDEGHEDALVDLQRGHTDEDCLFVAAEGAMSAEQALALAAELIAAAAVLKGVSAHAPAACDVLDCPIPTSEHRRG